MKNVPTCCSSWESGNSLNSYSESPTARSIKSCLKLSQSQNDNIKSRSLRSVRFSEFDEVRYIPKVKASHLILPSWAPSAGAWVYSRKNSSKQRLFPAWSSPVAHCRVSPDDSAHSADAPCFASYGGQYHLNEQVSRTGNCEETQIKVSSIIIYCIVL